MLHYDRVWQVSEVPSAEDLARMLTEQSWTLCSAFYVAGYPDYLFLNDAISENGAAEYGVVKHDSDSMTYQQIESITFSWISQEKALDYIRQALAGQMDAGAWPVEVHLETAQRHGRCHLCA
jgi:hypothetical protein